MPEQLNQLVRLFHTVRHITAVQLYYQVWYRVKRKFLRIHWYKKYLNTSIVFFKTQTDKILFVPASSAVNGLSFTFLGLTQQFERKIDWSFAGHGKLWNYNLQYLHYLLDDTIPFNYRKELLLDISEALLAERLLLEPYPVSLRIVNTLLFLQRTGFRDKQAEQVLLQQIDYLDNNLEYHLLANHLLENFFALFIAAQYLKNEKLNRKYKRLLSAALEEQILKDGGHYECTPMYQSILLSKLLLCIEVGKQSIMVDKDFLGKLVKTASAMAGWLQAYSFPDGSWALFNDAALKIAPTTTQIREAAVYLQIPIRETVLRESGFSKMYGPQWELVVKTGEIQPSYQPGHTHADIGSFCLWYQGIQYVVDPGISTYSVSKQRSWERSTSAHNTVAISRMNQSDVWGGFRVGRRASMELNNNTGNHINLVIKGYGNRGITVQRSFQIEGCSLRINDLVEVEKSEYSEEAIAGILFSPDTAVIKEAHDQLRADQLKITFESGSFEIHDAEVAYQYNQLIPTSKVLYKVGRAGGITIHFQ